MYRNVSSCLCEGIEKVSENEFSSILPEIFKNFPVPLGCFFWSTECIVIFVRKLKKFQVFLTTFWSLKHQQIYLMKFMQGVSVCFRNLFESFLDILMRSIDPSWFICGVFICFYRSIKTTPDVSWPSSKIFQFIVGIFNFP